MTRRLLVWRSQYRPGGCAPEPHVQEAEDVLPCIKSALCTAVGATGSAAPAAGAAAAAARKPAVPRMLVVVDNAEDALTEEQPTEHGLAATALRAVLQVRDVALLPSTMGSSR